MIFGPAIAGPFIVGLSIVGMLIVGPFSIIVRYLHSCASIFDRGQGACDKAMHGGVLETEGMKRAIVEESHSATSALLKECIVALQQSRNTDAAVCVLPL